jgi:transcriptional antiterminator NusG
MEEQESTELVESETTESEDVVEVADEAPPVEPEDLARRLFASYLEVPDAEQEEESDRDAELPRSDGEEEGEPESAALPDEEAQADLDIEPSEDDVSEGGRHWYVIHSYSGYENKVKKNLEHRIESLAMQNKIFEVVVPTEDEIELKDGQRRTVERRIFPGYILVEMIMDEDSWYVVRNTPGVTGFVGSIRRPTALPKRDVDRILKRMSADTPTVKVSFQPGQKVRIADGPFEDFVGAVDTIYADKGKVRILVSFFGRETPVELDFLQVEKI